jgi:hypothetical protein
VSLAELGTDLGPPRPPIEGGTNDGPLNSPFVSRSTSLTGLHILVRTYYISSSSVMLHSNLLLFSYIRRLLPLLLLARRLYKLVPFSKLGKISIFVRCLPAGLESLSLSFFNPRDPFQNGAQSVSQLDSWIYIFFPARLLSADSRS